MQVPYIAFMEGACNCQSQHRTAFHRQVEQGFLWRRALEALPLDTPTTEVEQGEGQEEGQEEEQEEGQGAELVVGQERRLREAAVKAKCQIIVQR